MSSFCALMIRGGEALGPTTCTGLQADLRQLHRHPRSSFAIFTTWGALRFHHQGPPRQRRSRRGGEHDNAADENREDRTGQELPPPPRMDQPIVTKLVLALDPDERRSGTGVPPVRGNTTARRDFGIIIDNDFERLPTSSTERHIGVCADAGPRGEEAIKSEPIA